MAGPAEGLGGPKAGERGSHHHGASLHGRRPYCYHPDQPRPCHHGGMSPGIQEWFADRIPEHWNAQGLEVIADQDEILVVVDLPPGPADGDETPGEGAEIAKDLTGFRLFREAAETNAWRWPRRPSRRSAARCRGGPASARWWSSSPRLQCRS